MPIVHGIEFSANQSELVKDLIRELLKDGNCAVYALPNMKPTDELRMAAAPPTPGPRRQRGVFLRIRPGLKEATVVRPMNAKGGQQITGINKFTQADLLEVIRKWKKLLPPRIESPELTPGHPPVSPELPSRPQLQAAS